MSVKRFFRLLLDKNWQPPAASVDDSLAKTAKDATHVHGGAVGGGPGAVSASFSGTSDLYKHIEEGHESYAKSFKKKDG